MRRQSTARRFRELPPPIRDLAFEFRHLARPRTRYSLMWMFIACTLLQLTVAVPYAANELAVDTNPQLRKALRGIIVGFWCYFIIGATFLIYAPTVVRGGFHPRFLCSLPITLGVGVGVAFIPVNGEPPGIVTHGLLAFVLGFVLCALLLNVPFFATDEHSLRALDQNLGMPLCAIYTAFFGLIST